MKDGETRGFKYLHENSSEPNIVLVFFHSYGSGPREIFEEVKTLCDSLGFRAMIFPQGAPSAGDGSPLAWDTGQDPAVGGPTSPEGGHLRLVKDALDELGLGDPEVVFVGRDNGAAMALRAACNISDYDKNKSIALGAVLHAALIDSEAYQLCPKKHSTFVLAAQVQYELPDGFVHGDAAVAEIVEAWGCLPAPADCPDVIEFTSHQSILGAVKRATDIGGG